ncbi:hypothetical protein AHAS_Ahas09G0160900 [Arachis hypogaea]
MESYKITYSYHINPIPGQHLWKHSEYNRPLAPMVKRKAGKLQTKRRKDADEGSASNKKSKASTTLKRQLRPFTCKYFLKKGHTKRGYDKKRAADAKAAAAAAAAKAKKDAKGTKGAEPSSTNATNEHPAANPKDANPAATKGANDADPDPIVKDPQAEVGVGLVEIEVQPAEIDLSQPTYSEPKDTQKVGPHLLQLS